MTFLLFASSFEWICSENNVTVSTKVKAGAQHVSQALLEHRDIS